MKDMGQKIRKTPEQLKRKYNATYRLCEKIGSQYFPQYSKIIKENPHVSIEEISEAKILLKEFGFIIKTKLF